MPVDRKYDITLYGASGFTGKQTVEYCRQFAPAGLRWAIAGRNRSKLEAVNTAGVDILVADSQDDAALDRLAAQSRVVATHGRAVQPLRDEVGRGLRAQSHSLLRHHRRDALDSRTDRSSSCPSRGRWHANRALLRLRFDSLGLRRLAHLAPHPRSIAERVRAGLRRTSGWTEAGASTAAQWPRSFIWPRPVRWPLSAIRSCWIRIRRRIARRSVRAMPTRPASATTIIFRHGSRAFLMGSINTRVVRRTQALQGTRFDYQEYAQFRSPKRRAWSRSPAKSSN